LNPPQTSFAGGKFDVTALNTDASAPCVNHQDLQTNTSPYPCSQIFNGAPAIQLTANSLYPMIAQKNLLHQMEARVTFFWQNNKGNQTIFAMFPTMGEMSLSLFYTVATLPPAQPGAYLGAAYDIVMTGEPGYQSYFQCVPVDFV